MLLQQSQAGIRCSKQDGKDVPGTVQCSRQTQTHPGALAVPPGDPALPVPAVVDAVGAGKLLARGAGVPALGTHQGDEVQLVQVDLQELHIFRLQQTSWAPGSIPLFPL